jgi:hypothetical protein
MKPADRIRVIQQSLSVFFHGLAGLIPVVGLLPASTALIRGFRLRRATLEPNPADNYRKWGMLLGLCGVLISIYAALLIVARLFSAGSSGTIVDYALPE